MVRFFDKVFNVPLIAMLSIDSLCLYYPQMNIMSIHIIILCTHELSIAKQLINCSPEEKKRVLITNL